MNRDEMRRHYQAAKGAGLDPDWDPDAPGDDGTPIGTPEAEITWGVELGDRVAVKRAALECHASQSTDVGMMLAMDPAVFAIAFGTEYFIEPGLEPGLRRGWWLDAD